MSNKKIVRYNLDSIDAIGATINLIYGERSNGKSYQVKHKKAVVKFIETGRRFILMRRWKEEITTEKIERYFADIDIEKLTNGEYNCVTMWRKQLFLSSYDNEKGTTKKGVRIGYVVALSTEQNYAGGSYLDVDDIIFEEFMSRSEYIAHESDKLMNFWNTVDRKQNRVRLWLVGNTISRVCPYISDWGLHKIVSEQKQGTIETVELPTGTQDEDGNEITIKLAIEYCASSGQTSYAIGKHKDMLNKGSWQSDPQPHLPKSYKEYTKLYCIIFLYKDFKFKAEYLRDEDNQRCWFVTPYRGKIYNNTLVFSDEVRISPYWQRDIYNPSISNFVIRDLLNTFRENNIFYATDLCGTDFKQVIDFAIKK